MPLIPDILHICFVLIGELCYVNFNFIKELTSITKKHYKSFKMKKQQKAKAFLGIDYKIELNFVSVFSL
jgi:hypothetical protein